MTPNVNDGAASEGFANPTALLAAARSGDQDAFARLAEPHRREIQLHCYRMLGAVHDAEDLVQETFLRAWRGISRFQGRASVRRWLYRVATNACLNTLASAASKRRILPMAAGPPTDQMPPREPATEIAWLEPYPSAWLEGVPDTAPGPEARYEMREAVRLAFVAAIQHLPPRQRATLLLRDVLGWSASESAELLETTVAAANSALQRARTTVKRLTEDRPAAPPVPSPAEQDRLDRYIEAWEGADAEAFAALLREDAIMSMPPWREWFRGRAAIRMFFDRASRPGGHGPFRLVQTAANGQPALAFYRQWQGPDWRPHSIQVVEIEGGAIVAMTSFVDPRLFRAFGLPEVFRSGGDPRPPPIR